MGNSLALVQGINLAELKRLIPWPYCLRYSTGLYAGNSFIQDLFSPAIPGLLKGTHLADGRMRRRSTNKARIRTSSNRPGYRHPQTGRGDLLSHLGLTLPLRPRTATYLPPAVRSVIPIIFLNFLNFWGVRAFVRPSVGICSVGR